eukprot:816342-Karenia_brevis.AAC.1
MQPEHQYKSTCMHASQLSIHLRGRSAEAKVPLFVNAMLNYPITMVSPEIAVEDAFQNYRSRCVCNIPCCDEDE